METWPASLPPLPLVQGYRETFADNLVETPMEAGPAKRRRRFTRARPRPLRFPIRLTRDQAATLDDFFHLTCKDGLTPFAHVHPRTGAAVTLQFRAGSPPSLSFRPGAWTLETVLDLEVL